MVPTIYCIPGFGADERIFSKLTINANLKFINWLNPSRNETLPSYVGRMSAMIDEEEPIIIGVSFGGMIALEIAKTRAIKQMFLVSSVKCCKELPGKMKLVGKLRLNKIFPLKNIQRNQRFFKIANRRLGAFTAEEQEFANAYRKNVNSDYLTWSSNQIVNWKNTAYPQNIIHIQGDRDLVFPIKNLTPTHIIKGGTHMMVVNRPQEVSNIINAHLQTLLA